MDNCLGHKEASVMDRHDDRAYGGGAPDAGGGRREAWAEVNERRNERTGRKDWDGEGEGAYKGRF